MSSLSLWRPFQSGLKGGEKCSAFNTSEIYFGSPFPFFLEFFEFSIFLCDLLVRHIQQRLQLLRLAKVFLVRLDGLRVGNILLHFLIFNVSLLEIEIGLLEVLLKLLDLKGQSLLLLQRLLAHEGRLIFMWLLGVFVEQLQIFISSLQVFKVLRIDLPRILLL